LIGFLNAGIETRFTSGKNGSTFSYGTSYIAFSKTSINSSVKKTLFSNSQKRHFPHQIGQTILTSCRPIRRSNGAFDFAVHRKRLRTRKMGAEKVRSIF
jgi:hypothetical protein